MTYFNKLYSQKFIIALFSLLVVSTVALSYKFPDDSLLTFGFSPRYLNIVETSLNVGSYSSQLIYTENQTITPEIQREPLYPIILMFLSIIGFESKSVVILQVIALVVSYLLFLYTTLKFFGKVPAIIYSIFVVAVPTLLFYSSVLYPFSFQLLFISSSLFLLTPSSRDSYLRYTVAGICMGLAIFERGSYILLPLFITIVSFSLRHQIRSSTKGLIVFSVVTYLFISPWLMRNLNYGTIGMNQIVGYSLGYTYGNLPTLKATRESIAYDQYLNSHGSDLGTLIYIENKVADGLSYTDADKLVARIATNKITHNPLAASAKVLHNLYLFPSRIGNIMLTRSNDRASEVYKNEVSTSAPTITDLVILASALLGLFNLLKVKSSLGLLWGSMLVYTIVINTIPVAFDVRYRGPLDLIIYSLFGYFIATILKLDYPGIWSKLSRIMTDLPIMLKIWWKSLSRGLNKS